MERKRFSQQACPIARAVDLLGDWWIPLILREAVYGVTHFSVFQERLDISKNILNQRLQRLLDEGLMRRELYQERPERYRYCLTEKGKSATSILAAMIAWSDRWIFDPGQHPIELYDQADGRRIRPLLVDADSGVPLETLQIGIRPGPGQSRSSPKTS